LNGAIYLNEFNRVFGYIKILWRTLQSPIISRAEERHVEAIIDYHKDLRQASFLAKTNEYLKFLQSLQATSYRLKALLEERESFIKMLRVHTQTYNPGDFAKNGVKLILKLRDINLKVVKTTRRYTSFF